MVPNIFLNGPGMASFSSIVFFSKSQWVENYSMMSLMGFEPKTFIVGSDSSTSWAITDACLFVRVVAQANKQTNNKTRPTVKDEINWKKITSLSNFLLLSAVNESQTPV